jgi:hypothetical protein
MKSIKSKVLPNSQHPEVELAETILEIPFYCQESGENSNLLK